MQSQEIEAIWQQMEAAASAGHELFRRRLEPRSSFNLFATVNKPSNARGLQMEIEDSFESIEHKLPRLRGLHLAAYRGTPYGQTGVMEIKLKQPEYREVFAVLISDLVGTVVACPSTRVAADALLNRLHSWQRFLELYRPDGLSAEAQRGLYGELHFLEAHLVRAVGSESATSAWTGPDRADQDFQLAGAAFEVKTTATAQPQQLSISSERQLDDSGLEALGLFHLSLAERIGAGQTLNELVDRIRELLGEWGVSRAKFEDCLVKSGYLDAHRQQYESTGYRVRQENLFRVENGFPRLVESDMPEGVGNVRYSIALSGCYRYRVDASLLKELLTGGGDDG